MASLDFYQKRILETLHPKIKKIFILSEIGNHCFKKVYFGKPPKKKANFVSLELIIFVVEQRDVTLIHKKLLCLQLSFWNNEQ